MNKLFWPLLAATFPLLSLPASAQTTAATATRVNVFTGGEDGYPAVRIPSIVLSKAGTLLAFAEGRNSLSDQAENDMILKRSTDGGKTWGALQTLAGDGRRSLNNPCAVVNQNTGQILLMFQSYPADLKETDGKINGDLSVVALVSLRSLQDGFLFDGSTGAGLTRAGARRQWQLGSQAVNRSAGTVAGRADVNTLKAQAGVWQTHAFVFRQDAKTATHILDGDTKTAKLDADNPLSEFVLGANGAVSNGLRADVAEFIVFDRALSATEIANIGGYLKTKWGTPKIVLNTELAVADKATLSAKLANKSKPLIWYVERRKPEDQFGGSAQRTATIRRTGAL